MQQSSYSDHCVTSSRKILGNCWKVHIYKLLRQTSNSFSSVVYISRNIRPRWHSTLCMYVYIYIYIYMDTCMYVCIHLCISYLCLYVRTFVCKHASMYICVTFKKPHIPDHAIRQPTELAWQIPIVCIQSWDTPDNGQWTCPKHVEYFIKQLREIMHLVGLCYKNLTLYIYCYDKNHRK